MSKIFVEDIEIKMWEKPVFEDAEHVITNDNYVLKKVVHTEFKADIYQYSETKKLLISKIERFGEMFYKIVAFDEIGSKAWNLIEMSCELEVRVKRLCPIMFFITGNSQNKDYPSQFSFCRLKPSLKVEEFTINVVKLDRAEVLDKTVIVGYIDDGYYNISVYTHEGRLIENVFNRFLEDGEQVTFRVEDAGIKVIKK